MLPKKLCLIAFLLLPTFLISQNITRNNLSDYSFKLTGVNSKYDVSTASGFIINYRNQDYLVTNYHVVTALDPITQQNIDGIEKPEIIRIWIHLNNGSIMPLDYNLYYPSGKSRFFTMGTGNPHEYYDIAVLPLDERIKGYNVHVIQENEIDTTTNIKETHDLIVVGFPKEGDYIEGWKPIIIETKSLYPNGSSLPKLKKGQKFFIFPEIYFDKETKVGMSGSPVYMVQKNKSLKVIAVNSRGVNEIEFGKEFKGSAIYMSYVTETIDYFDK